MFVDARLNFAFPLQRRLGAMLSLVGLLFWGASDLPAESPGEHERVWTEKGVPMIDKYCVACHNEDLSEGELDLRSQLDFSSLLGNREHWEEVLQRIRFETMPPEGNPQPTASERSALASAIEVALYGSLCKLNPEPGRVTVRRLNRAEYNNTIRDIFGQDLRPADAFPSDEVGAGFDNNSDVLSLPPMLLERYMAAAEQVASSVILDPEKVERIDLERSSDTLHAIGQFWVGSFYKFYLAEGGIGWAQFLVPYDGNYELQIAGSSGKENEDVVLAVYDSRGKKVETLQLKYSAGDGDSNKASIRLNTSAGEQRFFIARVLSSEEAPEQIDVATLLDQGALERALAQEGKPLVVDRDFDRGKVSFALKEMTLKGPRRLPEQMFPPSQRKLIRGRPWVGRSVAMAAKPGIEWLLRRAFRSEVDPETVARYVQLVELAHEREENFHRAMQIGVAAILVSPRFLFRVELPAESIGAESAFELSDSQLASRLSYFLWSSTPDDELLDLAAAGKLRDPAVLEQQVARMLADWRSEGLADNFAAQWWGLRNLDAMQPDPEQFPQFDPPLRAAMLKETRLTFLNLVRENHSILDLLDGHETYVNERLAAHYGIEGIEGDEFQRVQLGQSQRRGLLTQASILTLTSNPTRTSPVKRGKWILENILGTPPPEPPAGVPPLAEGKTAEAAASLREQLKIHREDPTCASCHRTMDDLGFAFENFDVIGTYRQREGHFPIDASGQLPGGMDFSGPLELVEILRKEFGNQFARTTAQRLLSFALGRELHFEDRCAVDEIVRSAAEEDFRFHRLVTEVVRSKAFRYQQLEGQ